MYRCDEGFKGVECEPTSHLKDQMQADFGIRYEPDIDFEHIRGGKVVHSNQGCGTIFADESLYFFDVRIVHCLLLVLFLGHLSSWNKNEHTDVD